MVSTQKQKQAVAAASTPLTHAGILQSVFSFLPGSYLFLGGVCRDWRAAHAGIEDQQLPKASFDSLDGVLVTCGSTTTLCSSVVASPATARQAADCGLDIDSDRLQLIAGLHADVDTLQALLDLGMPLYGSLADAAALSGRLHILQHLLTEQQCPVTDELSYFAARSGSVPMLQWLRSHTQCLFDEYTCDGAARGGHLAALKHLWSEGCDWDEESIPGYAAASGSMELAEWLRQQDDLEFDAEALSMAAGAGQLAMCEHLLSIGCEWDVDACRLVAIRGRLDTLRWLRERGCPWDANEVYENAACNNQTDILE
jgi:hypothetical protein